VEVARRRDLDEGVRDSFLTAASTLGADFDQRRALQALLDRKDLDSSWLVGILDVAQRGLGSDHDQAELLVEIARSGRLSPEARRAFLAALGTIGSDHDYRRTADACASTAGLDEAGLTELLRDAARQLSSDFEMAEFLVGVAKEYRLSGEAREAYLEACDTIGSSYDNQRVLAALVGGERRATSRSP